MYHTSTTSTIYLIHTFIEAKMNNEMPERIYASINEDENVHYEFVASSKPKTFRQNDEEYIRADLIEQASGHYIESLEWIAKIARTNYEQDEKLRTKGARALLRIMKRAEQTLDAFRQ